MTKRGDGAPRFRPPLKGEVGGDACHDEEGRWRSAIFGLPLKGEVGAEAGHDKEGRCPRARRLMTKW